jgi:hypothetical protein
VKSVRVSTVFVGMASVALLVGILSLRLDEARIVSLDTFAAVLLGAVLPVMALAGLVSSGILLFRDRSALRWVEFGLSATFLVFLSLEH